jgi:hypothetical protein
MANTEIIEGLTIRIDRACNNLIQVRWLNEQGTNHQYTFGYNSFLSNDNKDSKVIRSDKFSTKNNTKVLGASFDRKITVGAEYITADVWEQLSKIVFAEDEINGVWEKCSIEHKSEEVPVREGVYNREMTIVRDTYKLQTF